MLLRELSEDGARLPERILALREHVDEVARALEELLELGGAQLPR
jgi:hypothetical protein